MTFEEYSDCDGIELARLIQAGTLSQADVSAAAIAAIERLNPALNAVVMTDFAAATAAACSSAPTNLAGVPFLLKDGNLQSERLPTTYASRFFRGAAPKPDSTLVRRWRSAGLVILGKSNAPEFAGDFVTEPAAWGPTFNPWDPGITVGGSSGGAAAAVASGMVPIAHGSDLGGSIRIPASCCGVFGLKPTAGLNPVGPYWHEIASGLNSDHVLTRTVRDSAASLDITAGPDESSRHPTARAVPSYLRALDEPLPSLRIGVATVDPIGRCAADRQCRAVEDAARMLRDAGHQLTGYAFPKEAAAGDWFDLLWMVDVGALVRARSAELGRAPRDDELEPLSLYAVQRSARMSADEYMEARAAMNRAAVAMARSMAEFDLVLTPTLAEDPLPVGSMSAAPDAFDYAAWATKGYGFAPFSTPFNLSGQPAASCPTHVFSGVPVGVQLAGRRGCDHVVLAACRQLESASAWRDDLRSLRMGASAPRSAVAKRPPL